MYFICQESNRYALKKGFHNVSVTVEELYQYFAIVILPGYVPVASRRMFWETKADTFNPLVSNTMSRNTFESIHRFLHFCNNDTFDKNDNVAKMRQLIDHLNRIFTECIQPLGTHFSLEEAMGLYYGRHSMKQFIRGKPIRFGFKFWCLTTSDGYLIKFEPYLGSGDKLKGKTLGSSVTEKMCLNFIPRKSIVFIDNYFNSLPLLETLSKHELYGVGTIRSDRVEEAPLKELKKEKRGSHFTLYDKKANITLTRWHDNSQVNVATNLNDESISKTKSSCTRWFKKERSKIAVEQPSIINFYNNEMGGVDQFDQMRGLYRSKMRSKKWYWSFFRFCLNGAVVNMRYLYRRCSTNGAMPLL
nr:piggyBac transposable element-derived protein 2-like [Leptinotarsa decemlineata]